VREVHGYPQMDPVGRGGRIRERALEPAWILGAQALPIVGRKGHVLKRRRASDRVRGTKEKGPKIDGFVPFAISAEGEPDKAALREIASSYIGLDRSFLEFLDGEPGNAGIRVLVEAQDDTSCLMLDRCGAIYYADRSTC
jgi:hypothetical protein